MVTAKVNINTDIAKRKLLGQKSQVPFAMSRTLNTLAFNTKKRVDEQMKTRLDRPTRYTQRAINVDKSSKRKLAATVKVRDRGRENNVLRHLFTGGDRSGKRLEGLLTGLNVLPKGKYIVPGGFAPRDSHGNIRRAFVSKLVAFFKANKPRGVLESALEPGVWIRRFDKTEKKRRKKIGKSGQFEFFVVHKQKAKSISRKAGAKTRPPEAVLLFVDRPRYRRYFDMVREANAVIIKDLDREFRRNYLSAIKTAR